MINKEKMLLIEIVIFKDYKSSVFCTNAILYLLLASNTDVLALIFLLKKATINDHDITIYLPAELEGDPVILSTNPVTAGLVLTLPPVLPVLVLVPLKK